MSRKTTAVIFGLIFVFGCGLRIIPLKSLEEGAAENKSGHGNSKIVYKFFDECYTPGGYDYAYPDNSRVFIPEESGKNGEVALEFNLDAQDYSGGSVCLYNLQYDMKPYYETGALEFWIKGKSGGEKAWAALADDEKGDGKKTVVRLLIDDYGKITDEWTKISIPLADFGKQGVYWDPKKRVEMPEKFQWNKVCEFRLEIKKGDNEEFVCRVDDIFILRDIYESNNKSGGEEETGDKQEEILPDIPVTERPAGVKEIRRLFDGGFMEGGFAYIYGGKTGYEILPTESKTDKALACYMDNSVYSGVTLSFGIDNTVNLAELRMGRAGLAFWARAGRPEIKKVYVGLIDDEGDGKKVQTKLALNDFGKLSVDWKYFMIPLSRFNDKGKYWDESKKAELLDDVDWEKIQEIRFSINKNENHTGDSLPVDFYAANMALIEDVVGWIDSEKHWETFESDAPDVILHDFEDDDIEKWETASGENSDISAEIVNPQNSEKYGFKAVKIKYKLGGWCDCMFDYEKNDADMKMRDWSGHWGLRFSFYTDKSYQAVNIQVSDNGGELFFANTGSTKGWNELLLPFKNFKKFPYYQPPGAEENGRFDLDSIVQIDFKPAGEGTEGVFMIDNVMLTNKREIETGETRKEISFTVAGNPENVITDSINAGLFGINAALWDGDLLDSKTVKYVKALNHGVLRYPGGLRADEDHFKDVLQKKDYMVDTDEMADFADETGNELMITVNFGRGTPQEAADWVEHMNKKKNKPVRYWEVGNELYGDWHADHCTAEEYGKRAREFIKAMKAVDPDILVTVVWRLEGEWNRIVFEYTKDIADGVNVHNYPQHAGEENDHALLASPQHIPGILGNVRRQIEEFGDPEKDYEIWLTEWNSVDFEPGPQTIKPVNGLFVIDYIGMLTKINIEQASYWDIHNNLTPQGGDYGYLTRTGDPRGDNVPGPSYYAFKLVSGALRGSLCETEVITEDSDDSYNLTSYLAKTDDGTKTLLLVNKMKKTEAVVNIDIPGFTGRADVKLYTPEYADEKLVEKSIELNGSDVYSLEPYSAAAIRVK